MTYGTEFHSTVRRSNHTWLACGLGPYVVRQIQRFKSSERHNKAERSAIIGTDAQDSRRSSERQHYKLVPYISIEFWYTKASQMKWWKRFKNRGIAISLHEIDKQSHELEQNTKQLDEVLKPYRDADNPLIALTITLLNQQQSRE